MSYSSQIMSQLSAIPGSIVRWWSGNMEGDFVMYDDEVRGSVAPLYRHWDRSDDVLIMVRHITGEYSCGVPLQRVSVFTANRREGPVKMTPDLAEMLCGSQCVGTTYV